MPTLTSGIASRKKSSAAVDPSSVSADDLVHRVAAAGACGSCWPLRAAERLLAGIIVFPSLGTAGEIGKGAADWLGFGAVGEIVAGAAGEAGTDADVFGTGGTGGLVVAGLGGPAGFGFPTASA